MKSINIKGEKDLANIIFKKFGIEIKDIPQKIVICPFSFERMLGKNFWKSALTKDFKVKKIKSKEYIHNSYNYLFSKKDNKIFFCVGGRGASTFADSLFVLCRIPKVKEIIFLGSAGSLEDLENGDINIPPTCIKKDGVTDIILKKPTVSSDKKLNDKITNLFHKSINPNIKIKNLLNATMPFFFSENYKNLKRLSDGGVFTVDLELSVVYAFAEKFGKKSCGILRIYDKPFKQIKINKISKDKDKKIKELIKNCLFKL